MIETIVGIVISVLIMLVIFFCVSALKWRKFATELSEDYEKLWNDRALWKNIAKYSGQQTGENNG